MKAVFPLYDGETATYHGDDANGWPLIGIRSLFGVISPRSLEYCAEGPEMLEHFRWQFNTIKKAGVNAAQEPSVLRVRVDETRCGLVDGAALAVVALTSLPWGLVVSVRSHTVLGGGCLPSPSDLAAVALVARDLEFKHPESRSPIYIKEMIVPVFKKEDVASLVIRPAAAILAHDWRMSTTSAVMRWWSIDKELYWPMSRMCRASLRVNSSADLECITKEAERWDDFQYKV